MPNLMPYEGKEPFLFISYAHADSAAVMPYIAALMQAGYHVWYDYGIPSGTPVWAESLTKHIHSCTAMLVFLSDNYLRSDNCTNELEYMRNLRRPNALHLLMLHKTDPALERASGFALNHSKAHRTILNPQDIAGDIAVIGRAETVAACLIQLSAPAQPEQAQSGSSAPAPDMPDTFPPAQLLRPELDGKVVGDIRLHMEIDCAIREFAKVLAEEPEPNLVRLLSCVYPEMSVPPYYWYPSWCVSEFGKVGTARYQEISLLSRLDVNDSIHVFDAVDTLNEVVGSYLLYRAENELSAEYVRRYQAIVLPYCCGWQDYRQFDSAQAAAKERDGDDRAYLDLLCRSAGIEEIYSVITEWFTTQIRLSLLSGKHMESESSVQLPFLVYRFKGSERFYTAPLMGDFF